jgi:hypothetical protein
VLGLVVDVPGCVLELVLLVDPLSVPDELRVSDVLPVAGDWVCELVAPLVLGDVVELGWVDVVDDFELMVDESEPVVGRDCVEVVCACKLSAATKSADAPHVINLTRVFMWMCNVIFCDALSVLPCL